MFLVFLYAFSSLVVFSDIFLSFLFSRLYLCSRFMFYGYHEFCTKYLTDKIVLFLKIASYLHLVTEFCFSNSSPLKFLLSQIILFFFFTIVSLLRKYLFLLPLFLYLLYCNYVCNNFLWYRVAISLFCLLNTLLIVLCTFTFSFQVQELLSTFLVKQV